jgi:hypothetical protein
VRSRLSGIRITVKSSLVIPAEGYVEESYISIVLKAMGETIAGVMAETVNASRSPKSLTVAYVCPLSLLKLSYKSKVVASMRRLVYVKGSVSHIICSAEIWNATHLV